MKEGWKKNGRIQRVKNTKRCFFETKYRSDQNGRFTKKTQKIENEKKKKIKKRRNREKKREDHPKKRSNKDILSNAEEVKK